MLKTGVTILICTYNGGVKLTKTLAHLAKQIVPENISWEIILVDNASTDNTIAIALEEWKKYSLNIPFRVISEDIPGKLYALQKGIAMANYEYFIICDDDNWLEPNYINIAFDILKNNPKIGAVGGETIAVSDDGEVFPDWFETYKEGYAVGKQAEKSGDITWRGHLWGAGLASRTALYRKVYKDIPSLLIDENNTKILSAEDTEYCLRIILNGYTLYYTSDLKLKHFIPSARLSISYRNGLFENFSNAHGILEKYYLAIKFGKNSKLNFFNKLRLSAITPLRFIFSKANKNKQRIILSYLFPRIIKPDKQSIQINKLYTKVAAR